MKKQAILTLAIALISVSLFAQDFEAPKKGAKLYVENTAIEVAQNDETSFDLWLVKSKVARKASFEAPRFISPDGTEFIITADTENEGKYTVTVKANGAAAGNYSVTVMGKRNGVHAVTGMILSLNVTAGTAVAKDGE